MPTIKELRHILAGYSEEKSKIEFKRVIKDKHFYGSIAIIVAALACLMLTGDRQVYRRLHE